MNLETLDKRAAVLKEMIDKAFELEESVKDLEDDNDWAGAMTTLNNLVAVEDMLCAEEIFLNTFSELGHVKTYDDEKEVFLGIFYLDGLRVFVGAILLPRLKKTLDFVNGWDFKTEVGKIFQRDISAKVDALIKKYSGLYRN